MTPVHTIHTKDLLPRADAIMSDRYLWGVVFVLPVLWSAGYFPMLILESRS